VSDSETTVQQDISGALADAMMQAGKATAIVISMAMGDGSIWNFSAGSLIEKLGLVKAFEFRSAELWGKSEEPLDE
jgi:hypothetical protein